MTEKAHSTTSNVVAFDPAGEFLVVGHGTGAGLWNPASGRRLADLPGREGTVTAVACGGWTVAVATDAGEIHVWDTRTMERRDLGTGHRGPVWSVAVDPLGRYVASGGDDGTVRLWETGTDTEPRPEAEGPRPEAEGPRPEAEGPRSEAEGPRSEAEGPRSRWVSTGHQGPVWSVAFGPDGRLVAGGGDDGTIRLHNAVTGEQEATQPPRQPVSVLSVAFSPDGTTLAAALEDGNVLLSGTETGIAQMWVHASVSPVWSVAFGPDRRFLVSGGDDRVIRLWDAVTGRQVKVMSGHTGPVRSVAFAPDGVTIASGGEDVRLWSTEDEGQVTLLASGGLTDPDRLPGYDSDLPSEDDLLGLRDELMPLAMLAAAADLSPPLAVALIGEWGIGKSSAMLQMKKYVAGLAAEAARDPEGSAFASSVRQVWFNAWHYSDDHIWPGIVEHLFASLREDSAEPRDAVPEDGARSRRDLRTRLTECEALDERLSERLGAVDRADDPPGVFAALGSPVTLARTLFTGARQILADARIGWRLLVAWGVLAAAGYAAWLAARPVLAALTPVVAVLLAPAAVVARRLADWHRSGLGLAGWHRTMLDERRRAVRSRMARLREELAVADAAARLEDFLAGIEAGGTYRPYRGLVGQVHHDLARISAELEASHRQWREGGARGAPPLERIVLYIDDLDRCHPKLVVEVLAAIHLLIALPLFVVVVGVDSGWLVRSVERHLDELMRDEDGGRAVSPADYLDKIFQIPFRLSPPSGEQAASYVRRLLPAEAAWRASGARPAGDDAVAEAAERPAASAPPPVEGRGGAQPDEAAALPEEVFRVRPEGLRLTGGETAFLGVLAGLLGNPRKVKKLINLYRLVRVSVRPQDLPDFMAGPYRAVQVLLLLLVGVPEQAAAIFNRILTAPGGDMTAILTPPPVNAPSGTPAPRRQAFLTGLLDLLKDGPAPIEVSAYRPWCAHLRRYSFHDPG
ncbi:P-loop NTPase fold protein [Sphaerisporangium aureirubrum]|uniref:P-loop NTPase fold protein n=1 Tax=Sphaerisporangium aureirubrum TaxID=1544736 RepID=A0ABW1NR57_9ACTN